MIKLYQNVKRYNQNYGGDYVFNAGEAVVYANSGIYVISEIAEKSFAAGEKRLYYVLKNVNESESTVYQPVDGAESRIRYPITETEAEKLLNSDFKSAVKWSDNEASRKELFENILAEKDIFRLMGLICVVSFHRSEKLMSGKRLRANDEKALNNAKKLVLDELAYATSKHRDEILNIITGK